MTGSKKPKNQNPHTTSPKQGVSKDHWPKLPSTGNTQTFGQKKSGPVQNKPSQTKKRGPAITQKLNPNQMKQNHLHQEMLKKMLAKLEQQAEELKNLNKSFYQYHDCSIGRRRERSRSPRSHRRGR